MWNQQSKHFIDTYLKTYTFVLLIVTLPLAMALSFSKFGSYLNSYLYYQPLYQIQYALGLQPKLNSQIKIILLEDRSLERLGRHLQFSEWYKIAKTLFNAGFEKVFLHGFHNLPSEIGQIAKKHKKGTFIVGSVDLNDFKNIRATPARKIPESMLLKTRDLIAAEFESTSLILGPDLTSWKVIDKLGNLKIDSNNYMPIAYKTSLNAVLPNFALWAVSDLHWGNHDRLVNRNGVIPLSSDKLFYIEFIDSKSIYENSVAAASFFRGKNVINKISSGKLAKKLTGGKIAVLAPDAYTGSRFIDTPLGKVPGYFATISLINNTLNHRFSYRPLPHWLLILLLVPLILGLLAIKPTQFSLLASAGFAVLQLVAGAIILYNLGMILPCTEVFLITFAGWIVRASHHQLKTLTEKLKLDSDLKMGSLVQTLLMPKDHAGIVGGWRYQIIYKPHGHMSGDWLQVYKSSPQMEKYFAIVAIGDVVGKGPSAALITAAIASVWSNYTVRWDEGKVDILDFINSLDRTIFQIFRGQQNTTLSLAYLTKDKVTLYSCASPSWLKIIPDNRAKTISFTSQDPIGMNPVQRILKGIEINPEQTELFMTYTDGVIDGGAGKRRFLKTLEAEANNGIKKDFSYYASTAIRTGKAEVLPDDTTLILVQWCPRLVQDTYHSPPIPQNNPKISA